jgi:hypothetical protein
MILAAIEYKGPLPPAAFPALKAAALLFLILGGCSSPEEKEDAFELKRTQENLGVPVRPFYAGAQGEAGLDRIPEHDLPFSFNLTEKNITGVAPRDKYHTRKSVFAKTPSGELIEAYCGYSDDNDVLHSHNFTSTLENRRHGYASNLGVFHPKDVFIGYRVDGKLKPTLFFRDVGSHSSSPHHVAMDKTGQCHLVVADVYTGLDNPLKLYWMIGDLSNGRWTEARLIQHRAQFTYWTTPWLVAQGDLVHLVWAWEGRDSGAVCYVDWSPNGFGTKTRIFDGVVENLDVAADPDSGRLIVVFSNQYGVFVSSRHPDGSWTKCTPLGPSFKNSPAVSVSATGKDQFVIRTGGEEAKEYLLEPK